MFINCPECGKKILGVPRCEFDDHGNAYHIFDFTCSCGFGWIHNPNL